MPARLPHGTERAREPVDLDQSAGTEAPVWRRSTSDLQPVFDIIAKRATSLTNAVYSAVYLVEDESIHLRACYSQDIQNTRQFAAAFPMPLTSDTLIARTLRTGGLAHITDMEDVGVPEGGRSLARTLGVRSTLTVPMRRDGRPIGAIGVNRRTPGAFTPAEIALLQIFADQAVIAIENVRLFNETKERNQALTESLDQQTATGEILRVIASSPTDIDPVFAAVVSSAARLCDALDATIFQIDGDRLRVAVHTGPIASHPVGEGPSLARETPSGRAVLDRRTIHIEDTQAEIDESQKLSFLGGCVRGPGTCPCTCQKSGGVCTTLPTYH